jgi:hypothetical protein
MRTGLRKRCGVSVGLKVASILTVLHGRLANILCISKIMLALHMYEHSIPMQLKAEKIKFYRQCVL